MNKRLSVIAAIGALLCAAALSACGTPASSTTAETTAVATTVEQTSLQDQSIVGSWKTDLYGDEYVYTFQPDGTGTYTAAGKVMKLTYETKDGIYYETFEGSVKANERPYRIEGDQFIVEDTFGDEITYQRK